MHQDSSLDFKLVQRICLLQQALDQASQSLQEMQQQVANHQMLQAHLAQTEEFSNVQQKIILNLKQQLAAKADWQQQVLERMIASLKRLIDDQQLELERLRVRIYQSQTEVQDYLVRLKNYYQGLSTPHSPGPELDLNSEVMIVRSLTVSLSSQLQAAQQHIQQLDNTLTRHQVAFARMQVYSKTLEEPGHSLPLLPEVVTHEDPSQPACDLDHIQDPVALRAIIEAQQQRITELSAELGEQFHQQTSLRSHCQKIAAERDHLKQEELALRLANQRLQAQLSQAAHAPVPHAPVQRGQAPINPWQAPAEAPNPLLRLHLNATTP
ncbi:MAG TPA: hypothetical protein IGR64_18855 [Leptolyngbyaceae cyanobacterium M65_K2018_010]|nr:hypothetical protein [Leptolyngbyaceae cyanobacterium M65_K2018_010]